MSERSYLSSKYKWEDMTGQFQADLTEPEETIDIERLDKALLRLGEEPGDFPRLANSFDARLIGVINEWSEAVMSENGDVEYAQDGVVLDGMTATQYMKEHGKSFPETVTDVQKQLDNPKLQLFTDIGISIGGPAFMTNENVLESVKKFGQIHREGQEKVSLIGKENASEKQKVSLDALLDEELSTSGRIKSDRQRKLEKRKEAGKIRDEKSTENRGKDIPGGPGIKK